MKASKLVPTFTFIALMGLVGCDASKAELQTTKQQLTQVTAERDQLKGQVTSQTAQITQLTQQVTDMTAKLAAGSTSMDGGTQMDGGMPATDAGAAK